jgi:hypothetical protein
MSHRATNDPAVGATIVDSVIAAFIATEQSAYWLSFGATKYATH